MIYNTQNIDDQISIIKEAIEEIFPTEERERIFLLLQRSYGESHRGHHNFEHIAEMLLEIDGLPFTDPKIIKAAALFHDIVFDPIRYLPGYKGQGPSNEKESADIAYRELKNAGYYDQFSMRVSNLIIFTEKHKVDPEEDPEAAFFIDIDMSILGSPPERYKRYAQGTAKEFLSVLEPSVWYNGRKGFLQSTLERGASLFLTDHYKKLNQSAIQNMVDEIDILKAQERKPPEPSF